MSSPARSSPSAESVLILAVAGRQLAAAARAAGEVPVVIDCFGDVDTRALAADYRALPVDAAGMIDVPGTRALVDGLRRSYGPLPLVWGGGLEAHPDLLAALAPIYGTAAAEVAELIDPMQRIARCAACAVPTPRCADTVQTDGCWLSKRRGGAGGGHVQRYVCGSPVGPQSYLQAFAPGAVYSLSFVASRGAMRELAFNRALNLQPDPAAPFRYGGAITPAGLPEEVMRAVLGYAARLARACALRGLCGIDFVWDGRDAPVVLEINPRPTATSDLAVAPAVAWRTHIAACRGEPLPVLTCEPGTHGHLVCYATRPIRIPNSLDWPAWIVDRPAGGALLEAGAPICTIVAHGTDANAVEATLATRLMELWSSLGA